MRVIRLANDPRAYEEVELPIGQNNVGENFFAFDKYPQRDFAVIRKNSALRLMKLNRFINANCFPDFYLLA